MTSDPISALQPLLETLGDGVCVADADGRLLYANPAARRLLGPAAVDGKTVCALLCGGLEGTDGARAADCPLRVAAGPEERVTLKGRYLAPAPAERGGTYPGVDMCRDLRVRCSRVHLPEGERRLIVIEDGSEEAERERRLDEWRFMLAHDLRLPLTNALGALRTLEDEGAGHELDEEDMELVRIGVRACRRAELLVTAYLDVSRLEARAMPVERAAVDAAALARECAADERERARERGVSLRAEAPSPLFVRADPELLRRALMNLLDNALKFTPAGGAVTVGVCAQDGRVLLRVADTGPGISAAHLPRLFDRFYQVHDAGRPRGGGMGLGLTFCRAALRAMDGDVQVESEPGRGSVFTLRLPRASAPGGGS